MSRSPIALLHELEDALRTLKGEPLSRAVNHWRASGMGDVERVPMKAARNRFLDDYQSKSVWTRGGVRKEIDAFVQAHGAELCVCDDRNAVSLDREEEARWHEN